MTEIVAVDLGGTHVRFALAGLAPVRLRAVTVLKTEAYAGLDEAWRAYGESIGEALPKRAAVAVPSPVDGPVLRFANNPWVIEQPAFQRALGLEDCRFYNDFAAVGHAVALHEPGTLAHLCGPDRPYAADGVVSVVGPGTGLGVVAVVFDGTRYRVVPSEGGHAGFAPADEIDGMIERRVRKRFGRASVERIIAGPGLLDIHATLAEVAGIGTLPTVSQAALWEAALAGTDPLAVAAVERFCRILGAVAGDIALTHGSQGVVLAGGLANRLASRLAGPDFVEGFTAKGRMSGWALGRSVKLLTHPQPGLHGAAAAFARDAGA